MGISVETLAVAKKYTKQSIEGITGSLAGKNATIESITNITGGHRVIFKWTADNGDVRTIPMDVMNGSKGDKGETGDAGLGIKSVEINNENHLIITYDDDSTEDAGEIPGAGSLTSLSDTNISNLSNGQIIKWDSNLLKWINASLSIPSKTSDLANDSNFVSDNNYVHTDNNYDDTAKTAVDGLSTTLNGKVDKSSVGTSGGIAELDNNGKVPSSQLPSYVDDVKEGYYKEADGKFYEESTYETEIPGEADKIYISMDTDIQYRWTGSAFSALGGALQLGETSSTAYRGDRGKTAYDFSQSPYESNPAMNGHASAGSSNSWARGDHVHPSDSTKQDTMQVNSMPVPGPQYVSKNILQYKGATTGQYTRGYFYECVTDGTTYEWQEVQVQNVPTIGIGGGYAPIGTIISYMGTTAPQDYLACDGSTKNIADYPQLANFFEAQFGSKNYFGGDGVTTFAVPDLQGEFLRGSGTNSHANQGSGANVGEHQDATYHYLSGVDSSGSVTVGCYTDGIDSDNVVKNADTLLPNSRNGKFGSFQSNFSDNRVKPYTSRPTNTSVLYCIKAVVAGDVYSTDERVVGTWIDGKPLYQKTLLPSVTIPGETTVQTNITNAENARIVDGYYKINNYMHPLNFYYSASIFAFCDIKHDATELFCKLTGLTAASQVCVTVQYTKTTD